MSNEKLIEKINESAEFLMSLDYNEDYNLYLIKERELQEYVFNYTINIPQCGVNEERKYINFSQEIIDSINKTLQIYDAEKGGFVYLYKKILDNKIKSTLLKFQNERHGLKLPVNKQKDINKIIKIANRLGLNLNLDEDLIEISNILSLDFDYVYDLVKLNDNTIAIVNERTSIDDDENNSFCLFDTIKNNVDIDTNIINSENLVELLNKISNVYNKQRSDSKKVIKYMLTIDVLKVIDYVNKEKLLGYPFIEKDILDYYVICMRLPLLKDIAVILGKHPSSICRTYNKFLRDLWENVIM